VTIPEEAVGKFFMHTMQFFEINIIFIAKFILIDIIVYDKVRIFTRIFNEELL